MITLDKIKEKAINDRVGVNLVLKEYIHFLILDYLFRNDFFSHIVFQGGTALRFAYKGVRYSEDLDFVLKENDSAFFDKITKKLGHLCYYVDEFIPFAKNIRLKAQKNSPTIKRFILSMAVDTFQALDKTNIEFVAVPSYENKVIIINKEDIPANPAIAVESPAEILSDKFVAFGSRKYIKGRDIWDIFFLLDTLHVAIDDNVIKMCKSKISDYGLILDEFLAEYQKNCILLQEDGHAILKKEIDKFLPSAYKNLYKADYHKVCGEVLKILKAVNWG